MSWLLRRAPLVLTGLTVVASAAVAVLYVLAVESLAGGPNTPGYDLLAIANRSVPWIAVLVVFTVCTAFARRRVLVPAAVLLLSSGILGGLCLGAWTLVMRLAAVEPTSQPVDLNSLLLAVAGSAQDVAPASFVLAAGALALVVIRGIAASGARRHRIILRAAA